MLLSLPTWIIHISSMVEWLIASVLLYRYGALIGRRDVERFALLMLPHWFGGLCVLVYHITGDAVPFWFDASKVMNLVGSSALLYATLTIIFKSNPKLQVPSGSAGVAAMGLLVSTYGEMMWRAYFVNLAFQLSSVVYLAFLISLIVLYRRDPTVLSPLSIFGFWFLLVFVSVAAVCNYYATQVRGFPTLTHDDLLHGFAESFLTLTNLFIVAGIRQKLRTVEQLAP